MEENNDREKNNNDIDNNKVDKEESDNDIGNSIGREEWRSNIEKNIDNKKYIERGHIQQDNIDNQTEKNTFIKNNYGNNIEKEIACNDHLDNNSE